MTLNARVLSHRRLTPQDGVWTAADYLAILDAADVPDIAEIPPDELRDMCLLSLQQLEPEEAAALVLTRHLGGRMRKGLLDHLAHELGDEKQWEHYADMSVHEALFHVSALMWEAFPSVYFEPDAVRLELAIEPSDDESAALLAHPLHEPMLVRLLADGLPPSSLLHRLFDDQLAGAPFPEAASIVWTFTVEPAAPGVRVVVTGSKAWLGPLCHADPWSSDPRPDPDPSED